MDILIIGLILLLLALYGTPLFVIISAIALLAFHAAEIDPSAVIIELNRLTGQSRKQHPPAAGKPVPRIFRLDARRSGDCRPGILCHIHGFYRRFRRYDYRSRWSAISGLVKRTVFGKL